MPTTLQRCMCSLAAAVLLSSAAQGAVEEAEDFAPVRVDFFYEPGCPECEMVKLEILPQLESLLTGFYELHWHDVGIVSNVAWLTVYQQKLHITANEPVCMVVDYTTPFSGIQAIREGLVNCVESAVTARLAPEWVPPTPIAAPRDAEAQTGLVAGHVETFTLLAVVVGGLVDGVNPCAISTLVFFISLLAVAKVRERALLMMGAAFCLATFLTYTALGFGLLRILHTISVFPKVRLGIEIVLGGALLVLAWLSFRDAYRFRASGKASDVTLQLSDGMKRRIHAIMRTRLKTGSLVAAGFTIGAAVTAIESVCTGQVYVPTLVVVIKSGAGGLRAWSYLLLYNLMFCVPLVCVFALTYRGLRTQALLEWSKRNVVTSKILLGLFFLAVAIMLVFV